MQDEHQFRQRFCQKLKTLAQAKQVSVDKLSLESGIDKSHLHDLMEGTQTPSVGELLNLSEKLGVEVSHFFMPDFMEKRVEVVRATDRFSGQQRTEAARSLSYSYEALSYQMTDKLMLPLLVNIPPNKDKLIKPSSHQGEEFLYILSGQIEIAINNDTHVLSKGDTIYFNSALDHTIKSVGKKPARLIACLANMTGIHPDEEHPLVRALSYG